MADTKKPAADLGQAEVQKQADKELEQGFVGQEVDQTPNENYTVAGVTANKPTPENQRPAASTMPVIPGKDEAR